MAQVELDGPEKTAPLCTGRREVDLRRIGSSTMVSETMAAG